MYTEIRELVNFLARFFHLRVPKLKIGTFCEHMANNCLFRFQPYWNINQPKQHEEQRIIRISRAVADEVITAAATAVGLLLDELLNCLPERMILYINPGELFYTTSDYSPPVSIWVGSVNEDLNYEKNTQSLIPPPPLPSTILPQMPASIQPLNSLFQRMSMMSGNASGIQIANGYHSLNSGLGAPKLGLSTAADSASNMADFTMLEWRVNLALVHPRELGYELTNPFSGFLMFRYLIQGTPKFTVETFAATRFGSYRKRPDHEKKFVDAIKDFVNSDSSATNTESTTSTGGGTWSSSSEGGIWSTSPSPGFSVRRQQYGSGGIGGLEGYCPPMP